MSPDRLELPPEKVTLEVLHVQMNHLLKAIQETKESFSGHIAICREDMNQVYDRLRALEGGKPFNPAWIYGLGISLIAGIEVFRLLHWLK